MFPQSNLGDLCLIDVKETLVWRLFADVLLMQSNNKKSNSRPQQTSKEDHKQNFCALLHLMIHDYKSSH